MDDATNGEGSETYKTDETSNKGFWEFDLHTKFEFHQDSENVISPLKVEKQVCVQTAASLLGEASVLKKLELVMVAC